MADDVAEFLVAYKERAERLPAETFQSRLRQAGRLQTISVFCIHPEQRLGFTAQAPVAMQTFNRDGKCLFLASPTKEWLCQELGVSTSNSLTTATAVRTEPEEEPGCYLQLIHAGLPPGKGFRICDCTVSGNAVFGAFYFYTDGEHVLCEWRTQELDSDQIKYIHSARLLQESRLTDDPEPSLVQVPESIQQYFAVYVPVFEKNFAFIKRPSGELIEMYTAIKAFTTGVLDFDAEATVTLASFMERGR